jgi:hypothetical protein
MGWKAWLPIPAGARFVFIPQRLGRLWGPPTLLSNGYRERFPRRLSGRVVNLTTHFYPEPRSVEWQSSTSTPRHVFMAQCLINEAWG